MNQQFVDSVIKTIDPIELFQIIHEGTSHSLSELEIRRQLSAAIDVKIDARFGMPNAAAKQVKKQLCDGALKLYESIRTRN
jgi:hypothetical protein